MLLMVLLFAAMLLLNYAADYVPGMKHADLVGDIVQDTETLKRRLAQELKDSLERKAKADSLKKLHLMKQIADDKGFLKDYSGGADHGLQMLYMALDEIKKSGKTARIAYYGDSYVEGDVLTAHLREMFQDKFGGSGVGWADVGETTNIHRPTIKQTTEGFESFAPMRPADFDGSRQGLSQRYFTMPSASGTTKYTAANYCKHCDAWDESELFFRAPSDCSFTVTTDAGQQTLRADASTEVQSVKVNGRTASVRWNIQGRGMTLFGASCSSAKGVVLDNLAMRGCSGYTLAGIPDNTLSQFAKLRPYDMIILHYGLNVISPRSGPKHFAAIREKMNRVVAKFKAAYPKATIVVMSVPPRGSSVGGRVVTMKGVEGMVECQRQIAQDQGVVFMNLYGALGGSEAIGEMYRRRFVGHDYTHISFRAGEFVAQKIYEELMKRY